MMMFGMVGMTPIRSTMLGCLRMDCITISFWISFNRSSVIFGSNIFLIATGVPFKKPLWIVENPPWPIYSPMWMSFVEISRTPGTKGNLPAVTETYELYPVNWEKFDFWISFFKLSISNLSLFCSFFSCLSSSCTSLTLAFYYEAVVGLSSGLLFPKFIQLAPPWLSIVFEYEPEYGFAESLFVEPCFLRVVFSCSNCSILLLRYWGSSMIDDFFYRPKAPDFKPVEEAVLPPLPDPAKYELD